MQPSGSLFLLVCWISKAVNLLLTDQNQPLLGLGRALEPPGHLGHQVDRRDLGELLGGHGSNERREKKEQVFSSSSGARERVKTFFFFNFVSSFSFFHFLQGAETEGVVLLLCLTFLSLALCSRALVTQKKNST